MDPWGPGIEFAESLERQTKIGTLYWSSEDAESRPLIKEAVGEMVTGEKAFNSANVCSRIHD